MRYPSSVLSIAAERVAAACAYTYLFCMMRRTDVRYRVAKDPASFARIGNLRRDVYQTANSSYLINELDANGLDPFDQNATSFIAETRSSPGDVFAAIRTVRYPFEVLQFVSEEFLAVNIGSRDFARAVEVSRLVSSRPNRIVTNGLILFGGVYLALHGITRYFAYVALPDRGSPEQDKRRFAIPNRNPNGYTIVSGSIAKHAARIGPRLWRNTKSPGAAKSPGRTVVTQSSEPT